MRAATTAIDPEWHLYTAANYWIHERYDENQPEAVVAQYDLALVRLVFAADIAPYPINRDPLDGEVGRAVTYVGYGVSNQDGESGSGQKRRAELNLAGVSYNVYLTEHANRGVCFGDSGGPGLLNIGGQWRVVGINSAVTGADPPCLDQSYQTRVDSFQTRSTEQWAEIKTVKIVMYACAPRPVVPTAFAIMAVARQTIAEI